MAIGPHDSRLPRAAYVGAPDGLDVAAFDAFFEEHLERVYGFVARRIEARSSAEELTTVVFERAVEAARSGSIDPASLGAFTLQVAASALVDHARRARRPIPPGLRARDLDEGNDRAEAEALSDEAAIRVFSIAIDGDLLRRALLALPEDHQRAIMLRYLDGLAPTEIATLLGCSIADVSLRVNRALRALRGITDKASVDAA
jgi:RNA polymerase sigma-70 factor (ECF subfamily)